MNTAALPEFCNTCRMLSNGKGGLAPRQFSTKRPRAGYRSYCTAPRRQWSLIRCFRIADGLNTITRRGEIGTSVAVFGLRPIR